MNKDGLIKEIAFNMGTNQEMAGQVLDVVLKAVIQGLYLYGRVQIRGFGSLQVCRTKSRDYKLPSTGALITAPSRNRVRFSPGESLNRQADAMPVWNDQSFNNHLSEDPDPRSNSSSS